MLYVTCSPVEAKNQPMTYDNGSAVLAHVSAGEVEFMAGTRSYLGTEGREREGAGRER